jgi:ParB-like nuclease domain
MTTSKTKKARAGGNREQGKSSTKINDTISTVAIDSIFPSPENDEVYGKIDTEDHELVMLCNDIIEHGIREPIQVSVEGYIVSGHRRYAAAQLAGLEKVPIRRLVISRADHSSVSWKRVLASHNRQRVKTSAISIRESLLAIDPDVAYRQLIALRQERDRDAPTAIRIGEVSTRAEISAAKEPMLCKALSAINELREYWPLTVRQVHYRLLNDPPMRHASKPESQYQNDRKSYGDLCDLLARARLSNRVPWQAIIDETRPVSGTNYYQNASEFVDRETQWFLRGYRRNLMQSQADHIELIAEKLTVQSIIKPIADQYCIPMTIGRGYCSLEPRRAIASRFASSGKDRLILLVASDLDPDGESIAESFARSIRDDFDIADVKAIKCLLTMEQVSKWSLPPNGMEAKKTSGQYTAYRTKYGTDRVYELEAIEPARMQSSLIETIDSIIDPLAFNAEIDQEKRDAAHLSSIKQSVGEHLATLEIGGGNA